MTEKKRKKRLPDLILGPLPVEGINRAMGLELEPGEVVLTGGSQVHANKRHPEDYPECLPHIAGVVTDPLYVGDDFKNPGNIELIGRVRALGSAVLVALVLEKDEAGRFKVASFYKIRDDQIQKRREKGYLKTL